MSGTPAYTVRVAADPADLEACRAVRKEVFVREQGVPEDLEYDEHDAGAVHVLAVRADGTPLGTGRLLTGAAAGERTGGDPAVGSLGRLAVAREARGLGVGVALVRAVDLHAQTQALGFYERLGYTAYGPEELEAGIPHRSMRRSL